MPDNSAATIHCLTSANLPLMREMLAVFAAEFEEPETYPGAQPADAWVSELLGSDGFIALAAIQDGAVVGALAAYELTKFEQARREVHIYDLAVQQAYGRQGIATALIEETRRIAKAQEAWVVHVQADVTDPPAIALYSKLGRREEVLHFDIPVD